MNIADFRIILDIIIAFGVIIGSIAAFTKRMKRKVVNTLIQEIDENSPDCYATEAIRISHDNSDNIKELSSNVSTMSNVITKLSEKLDKYVDHELNNWKSLKSLEIMHLIDVKADILQVSKVYDEYKKQGGNSYIDIIYKKYVEEI
jgi:hypothetical protein